MGRFIWHIGDMEVIMLFERALLYGLIFSILFGAMILFMIYLNPRYQLHNYPPEIKKTVPAKTPEEQRKFKLLAIPMMLILFTYVFWTVIHSYIDLKPSYLTLLGHCFIIMWTWNIFDIFIMDWLLFCTITPNFLIIPGSEGNPAYKDYKFHLKGGLGAGTIISAAAAVVVSGICYLIICII